MGNIWTHVDKHTIVVGKITTLAHELLDDTMERASLEAYLGVIEGVRPSVR